MCCRKLHYRRIVWWNLIKPSLIWREMRAEIVDVDGHDRDLGMFLFSTW